MKYKKSIFIIIIIALISSVISLSAGSSRKNKPTEDDVYPKTIKIKGKSIKLLFEPVKDTPLISNLLLEEEKWDKNKTIEMFGVKVKEKTAQKSRSKRLRKKENAYKNVIKGNIKIYPSGKIIYTAKNNLLKNPRLFYARKIAIKKAADFMNLHGGIPKDIAFKHVLRTHSTYQVIFKRTKTKYGYRISGEDDVLRVELDDTGVIVYQRAWRNANKLVGKKSKAIAASDALRAVAANADKLFSDARLGYKFTIRKMELVWWSDSYDVNQIIAPPAWAFEIIYPEARTVYVNAITGKLLSISKGTPAITTLPEPVKKRMVKRKIRRNIKKKVTAKSGTQKQVN